MTIEITKLSHDGRGVGRDSAGKTVFIDGVLPGEQVTYQVKRNKRRFNEGVVLEIQKPAQHRVIPKCQHFLTCGGCAQQHISPEAQLSAKQQSVLEQLQHFGNVQPENVLPPITGPVWGYRNKARLGVRYVIKKEKVLVGFREKHSNYLAEIEQCEILHPTIGKLITTLQALIQALAAYQTIAQIEVAVGDDRMALVFRNLQALSDADQQILIAFAMQHDFDLYLQPDKVESVFKLWPQDGNERLLYTLPAYNLTLAFHPMDFIQINPAINRKMLAQAMDLLQLNPQDHVLDLFCGLGNFTLPMATIAASVTGVEGAQTMVQRGYENAQRNDIHNVSFFAADLTAEHYSSRLNSTASWVNKNYTKVVLDPPRSGALEILPLVADLKVDMILYVSCNPATLARDAGVLTQQYGYKLTHVGIMDMFPHTMHVETMALFMANRP